jgi:hypothetical protein
MHPILALPSESDYGLPPVESQAYVPTFEPGDTVPEEDSKLAQHAPWMETVPPMDAPDTAPAINCNRVGVNMKTYAVYRIGYWNNKLELIGKGATDFSVTPWFCWWAMKESNLQPPDEENPSVV